jgi:hypothetical protein
MIQIGGTILIYPYQGDMSVIDKLDTPAKRSGGG